MKCLYCDKEFLKKTNSQKFCCKQHGVNYRATGKKSIKQEQYNKQKSFIKKMLGIKENIVSFKVEHKLPSWQEVSEAIERADSEHCKALERETAALQECNQ